MVKGYLIVGRGSMLGEEDAVSNSKMYTTNVRCHTIKASVYAVKVEDFLTLKNEDQSWCGIVEKSLWKERKKIELPMHALAKQEVSPMKIQSYDITKRHFEELHNVLGKMEGKERPFQYQDSSGYYRTDKQIFSNLIRLSKERSNTSNDSLNSDITPPVQAS